MNVAIKNMYERRHRERKAADRAFEHHRENCPVCDGHAFHDIRGASHKCEEGNKLAQAAYRMDEL